MMIQGCAGKKMNECLFPRAKDSYVGDVMALSTEKGVYLNYLYETDNNGVGYHPIHQFYTRNFVSFEDKGQVLAYSEEMEAPDLAVGTGSFIIDDAGTYHCFYTGHNDYHEEYGLDKECLMHATSKDNKTYTKDAENIIHAPEGYSTEDFRDPQVLRTDDGYMMLVGARKENGNESAIICYRSDDLKNWKFEGDLYTNKDLYFMECPDLFKMGNHYYLTFSWNNVVYYRMSDSINGPWEKPETDTFDGNGFYAAKTCEYKGKRYLIGFLDRKKRENDRLPYTWAGNLIVYELKELEDGTLGVAMPEEYINYFDKQIFEAESVKDESELGNVPESCRLTFELEMENEGKSEIIFNNAEKNEEYRITIDNGEDKITYDAYPNEQKMSLQAGVKYQVDVVVEKDITVVYVNGEKALSNRIYSAGGADWKIRLQKAKTDNLKIYGRKGIL